MLFSWRDIIWRYESSILGHSLIYHWLLCLLDLSPYKVFYRYSKLSHCQVNPDRCVCCRIIQNFHRSSVTDSSIDPGCWFPAFILQENKAGFLYLIEHSLGVYVLRHTSEEMLLHHDRFHLAYCLGVRFLPNPRHEHAPDMCRCLSCNADLCLPMKWGGPWVIHHAHYVFGSFAVIHGFNGLFQLSQFCPGHVGHVLAFPYSIYIQY